MNFKSGSLFKLKEPCYPNGTRIALTETIKEWETGWKNDAGCPQVFIKSEYKISASSYGCFLVLQVVEKANKIYLKVLSSDFAIGWIPLKEPIAKQHIEIVR